MDKEISYSGLSPSLKSKKDNTEFPMFSSSSTEINGDDSKLSDMEFSKFDKQTNVIRENLNFSVKIYKKCEISIYKPLVPLKIAQFCWFGGASYMLAFLTVFLKQRGVSLSQFSWMNVITPAVQLCGTTLTGIIADKTGKSKPVLVVNLLLAVSTIIGILLMPNLRKTTCRTETAAFSCPYLNYTYLMDGRCEIYDKGCYLRCSTFVCNSKNSTCSFEINKEKANSGNKTINNTISIFNESCFFDRRESNLITSLFEICYMPHTEMCHLSCSVTTKYLCQKEPWSWLLIGYIALYVFYMTSFTNVYRCLDITAVALVKEHGLDFGRERFFAVCGSLLISPLAGYIAEATTVKGEEKNYAAGFYLFIFMVFLVLTVIYKIPMSVKSPGEKMGRNSLYLLKNPDILSLIFVVLVLGTAFNFTKIYVFWFLSNLNASSVLIGLIPSIGALCGLPLLLTSNWWVKKIGCTNLIVLAFLGYALACMGYSFLVNPWYSLVLEMFGSIEYYLLWVAVVTRSHELAPEGLSATVVCVVGALHYSVGKATCGLIGGLVMNTFGERIAFRFIATICLISAFLYVLYLSVKHRCTSKELQLDLSS